MNDKPNLTRAQKRAARRARRNTPQAKARRQQRLNARAAMAADRFTAMRANEFDPAWKVMP